MPNIVKTGIMITVNFVALNSLLMDFKMLSMKDMQQRITITGYASGVFVTSKIFSNGLYCSCLNNPHK